MYGAIARLDPPAPEIATLLSYTRRTFERGGGVTIGDVALYTHDFRRRMAFPTGLVPRAVTALRASGATVSLADHRQFDPTLHSIDATQALTDAAASLLAALARQALGQIEVPRREICDVVQLVCLAFPYAKIVIPVATRRHAQSLYRLLGQTLGPAVGIATAGTCSRSTRITVATYRYLNGLRDQPIDLVLLPDAVSAISDTAKHRLAWLDIARPRRVYAIVPLGLRMGPVGRLCLEAISGPVIWRSGPEPLPVQIYRANVYSAPATRTLEGLAWKRAAYWLNDLRNDALAAIATALANRDMAGLWERGLLLDAATDTFPPRDISYPVAVVVESLEHGRELLKRLPGWRLRSGLDDAEAVTPGTRVIATLAYAARHPLGSHAIVHAGGDFPLDLPGFPLPAKDARPGQPALVIDVADDFDPHARRISQDHLRDYQRRGWTIGSRQSSKTTLIPAAAATEADAAAAIRPPEPATADTAVPADPALPTSGSVVGRSSDARRCLPSRVPTDSLMEHLPVTDVLSSSTPDPASPERRPP